MYGKFDNLSIACLTAEQRERTCGYWYVVQNSTSPHTAFRTREALQEWLDMLNLTLERPLPETLGEHQFQRIRGSYSVRGYASWRNLPWPGDPVIWLSNGDYTTAVITGNAHRVVHVPSPNDPERARWSHAGARKREDEGRARITAMTPLIFLHRDLEG